MRFYSFGVASSLQPQEEVQLSVDDLMGGVDCSCIDSSNYIPALACGHEVGATGRSEVVNNSLAFGIKKFLLLEIEFPTSSCTAFRSSFIHYFTSLTSLQTSARTKRRSELGTDWSELGTPWKEEDRQQDGRRLTVQYCLERLAGT